MKPYNEFDLFKKMNKPTYQMNKMVNFYKLIHSLLVEIKRNLLVYPIYFSFDYVV